MIRVSIGTSKNYQALVINVNGKDLKIDVNKYTFDVKQHNEFILDKIIQGVQVLQGVLDTNHIKPDAKNDDEFVIIEFKNQHVYKWVTNLKIPKQHSQKLLELISALDNIPYHIKYVNTQTPKAQYYATDVKYKQNKTKVTTSLDDLLALTD